MPKNTRKKQKQAAERAKTAVQEKLVAAGRTFLRGAPDSCIWHPIDGSDSLIFGPESLHSTQETYKLGQTCHTPPLYYVAKLDGAHIQDYFPPCVCTAADVQCEVDFSRWGFIEGGLLSCDTNWLDTIPMRMKTFAQDVMQNTTVHPDAINTLRASLFGPEYSPFEYYVGNG